MANKKTRPFRKTARMYELEEERGQSIQGIVRAAMEAGATYEEVADDLGINRATLWNWLSRMGAECRVSRRVTFTSEGKERQ